MNEKDLLDLKNAVLLLENPSLGSRIADVIGTPIEKAIALLPKNATNNIATVAQKAIHGALRLSLKTLSYHNPESDAPPPQASNWWHMAASATTGAIGGAFGLAALSVELPISTTIMLRSIADVARSEGSDMNDLQTQLECVQVLAMGGPASSDDGAEVGYFVAREAMARAVSEAAAYLAKHGMQKEVAPAVVRLILHIAERYSITVTEKAAAQLVPIVGGIGGALINTIFIDHFQSIARGHFTVRRLERKYSPQLVQQKYLECKLAQS